MNRHRGWLFILFSAVAVLLLVAPYAKAQGCALCYTQAAASGRRMINALRNGIIILVVPPMFLSALFSSLVYRKRHQFRRADYAPKDVSNAISTTTLISSGVQALPPKDSW